MIDRELCESDESVAVRTSPDSILVIEDEAIARFYNPDRSPLSNPCAEGASERSVEPDDVESESSLESSSETEASEWEETISSALRLIQRYRG